MCTQQNIQDALKLKMFDSTFEVDQNYELNTSLIVKQYIRPNQGKQETVFRSDVGMMQSIRRLHMIFCDRQKRKKDGKLVSIVEIFQYISDRFRALSTELKQIESKNRSSISNSQVKQFSCQIVRIYLLSYLEMMQADQNWPVLQDNKNNCHKYLLDALDDLAIDYKKLFNEINESRFYLLDNLPEFISYYHIMLSQKILSTNSITKLANLDNVIFSEFSYFDKLIKTSEYQFSQLVKEYLIQKNYSALLDLGQNSNITLFQQFFIYLFQDQIEQYIEKFNQQIFQHEKLKLNFINIGSIYQKWLQIDDKISFINKRGDFSKMIFQQGQIENINYFFRNEKSNQQEIQQEIIKQQSQKQVDQETKKMKSSIQEILLQLCQKQVLNKFTKFLAPHLDKVDEQLGNFYKMQRILKHWRLYSLTEKRYKNFVKLCQQKNEKNVKKQIKIIDQPNFRIDLSRKLIQQNPAQKNQYYKIVILNNDEQQQQLVSKLIFSLCDQQLSGQDDSIIIEQKIAYSKSEYTLYMSVQIMSQLEKERICGTDIYIAIGDVLKVNVGKPCLQIVFDQDLIENSETLKLDYEYIALFDKLDESYEFNKKLNEIVNMGLKSRKAIEDLKLISLGDYLKEIKRTECQDYQKDQIEYFITRCVQAELCLEDALNNNIYSDDLPQELLFDRYVDQELVLKYVAKFNPANRLMIPLCNLLQKNTINERVVLNQIKDYLDEYLDEEELLVLLKNHFKFGINCQGDWKLLFEFIMEQLVQYLEDSDIYFVLKGTYNTILDQNKLKVRVQKDLRQLLNKNQVQQQKSQIMSKIFKSEWLELIENKKVCK
ncbi:unnamed protein product (macronuclear) [Paramecium tetraurelia]|uniref:Uncharacterized protein n=1 Tax=Paramecium tetraurelia TaxID=5888 RepID=A0DU77_PARTE|nr:uncharacterized protein GSPATT00020266001 [Paramecium tetraurelia]CAK86594.1 unnamed protein product [Paramecium tetraurelia]|eukprot:XP_001453991.1 hypothetical protein (macronuclear) [Paramecium tetraurelia strain d4-2]